MLVFIVTKMLNGAELKLTKYELEVSQWIMVYSKVNSYKSWRDTFFAVVTSCLNAGLCPCCFGQKRMDINMYEKITKSDLTRLSRNPNKKSVLN